VVSTSAGPRVRVWNSKGKAYRETPTTKDILAMAKTVADLQGPETPLVDHSTRWVQRHLDDVTSDLAEQGDEMWAHVTPHDLRRTWATLLSADIDDPLLIMDFGGWEDIETFLEHYRGSYSPAVQRRELSKVDWLDVGERGVGELARPEVRRVDAVLLATGNERLAFEIGVEHRDQTPVGTQPVLVEQQIRRQAMHLNIDDALLFGLHGYSSLATSTTSVGDCSPLSLAGQQPAAGPQLSEMSLFGRPEYVSRLRARRGV
jgi:hypothetical protein